MVVAAAIGLSSDGKYEVGRLDLRKLSALCVRPIDKHVMDLRLRPTTWSVMVAGISPFRCSVRLRSAPAPGWPVIIHSTGLMPTSETRSKVSPFGKILSVWFS